MNIHRFKNGKYQQILVLIITWFTLKLRKFYLRIHQDH